MTTPSRETLSSPSDSLTPTAISRINAITRTNLQDPSLQQGVRDTLGHLKCPIDTNLDEKDILRIMNFQRENNIKADGIIGAKTVEKYRQSMARIKTDHTEKVFALPGGLEGWYATSLTRVANTYQGNPYDTPLNGADGTTRLGKDGIYTTRDNYTGASSKSEKKPLVCIDLITQSLRQIGCLDMRDFQSFVGKDPYGMRRVTEFEKYVKARPEKYDIHTIGAKVNYGSSTPEIPKLTGIQVGDIITTRDVNGGRHIVICTAVSGGIPTRCIHASGTRSAVVETAFYNTPGTPRPYDAILPMRGSNNTLFAPIRDAQGSIRTDGAIPYQGEIVAVIRSKPRTIVTAMNQGIHKEVLA